MSFTEHFRKELNNPRTNYFILDTKGSGQHGDIDFVQYQWSRSRYNLVTEEDLFLCRRPREASETKQFYFFGAAKIGAIIGNDRLTAHLVKPYPFQVYLHPQDLENFKWSWKRRGRTWEHFFHQYGMNKITKVDFLGLLRLSEGLRDDDEYDPEAATEATQNMQKGIYSVNDREGVRKMRSKQAAFSNKVKTNYRNRCAVCSLSTKQFLVGSHIIPWSDRKDTRLDPANGVCLCSLHDKAFDEGFITIDNRYQVVVTKRIVGDPVLIDLLDKCDGKKILLPKQAPPGQEYLEYHQREVFESHLTKGSTVPSELAPSDGK